MKHKLLVSIALLGFLVSASPARADRVAGLVRALKTNPSYKVRLTAVLGLAKYADPRAVKALIGALSKSSEDSRVRGFAAMALGRLRAYAAIKALRKAARSSDRFLKSRARKAMERMCPSSLSGKRFYLNLDKIKTSGPQGQVARTVAVIHLARILAKRSDATTGWPRCKRPSKRALRRKRMKAFYLDTRVKVKATGGGLKIRVSVLFTTYPGQSIKGNAGASAGVQGDISSNTVASVTGQLLDALASDISRFLDSQ